MEHLGPEAKLLDQRLTDELASYPPGEVTWIVLGQMEWLQYRRELASYEARWLFGELDPHHPAYYHGVPIAVVSMAHFLEVLCHD
jgi:hypothetical protein